MSYAFDNKITSNTLNLMSMLGLDSDLSNEDKERLQKIQRFWNFYEGYHWEEILDTGEKPQITENYCRAFVNKFVAFEFGTGFTIKSSIEDNKDEMPITDFLNDVWEDNDKNALCVEFGQAKSVSGFSAVQVIYEEPNSDDIFDEYPKGRIRILAIPSNIIFPKYDSHDRNKLTEVMIAYPIEYTDKTPILRRLNKTTKLYKQIWTNKTITIEDGKNPPVTIPNKLGIIPFVIVPNFPLATKSYVDAQSDLEDLIPLNIELNTKTSDVSEIIDYYSAPVTIMYGAKASTLEKGANKLWGGLPTDARVQNLELQGDLGASNNYRKDIKNAMHEIGSVPLGALGGEQAISNTSSVALTIANFPIIERTRVKRTFTAKGLQQVNKLILYLAEKNDLFKKPSEMSNRDYYKTEVIFPDILPKDKLIELQMIQLEMKNGLEHRRKAMERLGKTDIADYIRSIDEDIERYPQFYGQESKMPQEGGEEPMLNSGVTNGETPIEVQRKELTGKNGE